MGLPPELEKIVTHEDQEMGPHQEEMDECDIMQMNRLRKAGIDTLDIYNSFASKLGGYLNVQFGKKKNMYNQISRQRRLGGSDGASAIEFLRVLTLNDL